MTAERPLVIQCDACGTDVEVKPSGNIPKYCKAHRHIQDRKMYFRRLEAEAALAQGASEDPDEGGLVRVCRALSCSIPLHDTWLNDWCPAHWRIISVKIRGDLLAAEKDSQPYDKAALHAIREINAYEGRAAFLSETAAVE